MKKDILKMLFYGEISEANRTTEEFVQTQERKNLDIAYEKMYETFSGEQKELFEKYCECDCGYQALYVERTYANAFKAGFWLAVELIDFDKFPIK